jgi:voltage-gated potassium channel
MRKVRKLWNLSLTLLAVMFLIVFSIPAFVVDLSDGSQGSIELIQWICWLAFALDLLVGLLTSSSKKEYLLKHPLELASVLLPFLRPLRLMRVISFGGLALQKIAMGKQFAITVKVAITAVFISYIAAVQITISERDVEGSNIKTFDDGLWWAVTTVTTVGYGDRFPTTTEGRILAVMLMLVGISLVGVITASVASWFVRLSQEESRS